MKNFSEFISEASTKRCPPGQYYCYTDKKCKKIPKGYHIGGRGYLARDNDDSDGDSNKNGNGGNGNGNGGSGNGGNGNVGGNGGGNGGGGNGG